MEITSRFITVENNGYAMGTSRKESNHTDGAEIRLGLRDAFADR
jgi:TPP-dependent pyruvate/acetoin dehydrogenase alpha subunit